MHSCLKQGLLFHKRTPVLAQGIKKGKFIFDSGLNKLGMPILDGGREANRLYGIANKEKIKERSRAHYYKYRDKINARHKKYTQSHSESLTKYRLAYRITNRERLKKSLNSIAEG